jgi:predicted amidohydrolase
MWQQMEDAARNDIDLLIFPEFFVTGYKLGERVAELTAPQDGGLAARITDRAAASGIAVLYGYLETVRRYACEQVELVLVPTSLMAPFSFVASFLVPARAAENQIFVAYANRCALEGDLRYLGRSCVCGPQGEVLAQADSAEGLVVAELEADAIHRARQG